MRRKFKCRQPSLSSKACTPTSASDATKSACSAPERNNRSVTSPNVTPKTSNASEYNGQLFDEQMQQQIEDMMLEGKLDELIEQIMQRMQQEDYISIGDPHDPAKQSSIGGQPGQSEAEAKFEITDKSLDFLGFRTLRE